jgi:hypothetical protein
MNNSQKAKLLVLHRLKDAAGQGLDEPDSDALRQRGFFLDTCLRQLTIMVESELPRISAADNSYELFSGRQAYSFLLQTATGLNSSIPGESNILGQFRHGWNNWRNASDAEQVCKLHSYMHQLMADSRRIRSKYLQGIGGTSYGSLVRKQLQPAADDRILFVGTGKLAHSILSLFNAYETALWNHRDNSTGISTGQRRFAPEAAAEAAAWANHIVITTPADRHHDRTWAELAARGTKHIVHLGRRRARRGVWSEQSLPFLFSDLDDIFALRRKQSSLRTLQIMRARKACEQQAVELSLATDSEPVDEQAADHHSEAQNTGLPKTIVAQGA